MRELVQPHLGSYGAPDGARKWRHDWPHRVALGSLSVAVRFQFESKSLKPGFHLIGSRVGVVETRRLSSYASTGFSVYRGPTSAAAAAAFLCRRSRSAARPNSSRNIAPRAASARLAVAVQVAFEAAHFVKPVFHVTS
jgi:hypothetical protein